jgi:hypothetical protein
MSLSPLAAVLQEFDAGAVVLGKALQRRLDACRARHALETRRKKRDALPPGKQPRWFNWSGYEVNPSSDFRPPPPKDREGG